MSNVIEQNFRALSAGLRGGPQPPDNGDMETRITRLESLAEKTDARLHSMEKDIAIIKTQIDGFTKHYASKADLTEAKNSIIVWVVSAMFLAQLLPAVLKKMGL